MWGRYLDRARAVLARRPLLAAEQEAVTSAAETVAYVNPAEAAQFLAELQALMGRYQHRLADQSLRPADAMALELLLVAYPLDAVPPGAGRGSAPLRQAVGEELGQVGAGDVGELVELGAAGEAVGQDGGAVAGRPDRREQCGLGDGDRHVVVALLDAEVAGQAAAAADGVDRGAGLAEQGGVGVPAEDGVLVAVRLGDAGDIGQVGRGPAVGGAQQFREGLDRAGQGLRARVTGEQLGGVAAQRGGAGRLEADDGDAGVEGRRQGGQACGGAGGGRRRAGRWRSRSGRSRRCGR